MDVAADEMAGVEYEGDGGHAGDVSTKTGAGLEGKEKKKKGRKGKRSKKGGKKVKRYSHSTHKTLDMFSNAKIKGKGGKKGKDKQRLVSPPALDRPL